MIELAASTARAESRASQWTAAERRTLWGVLGFIAGLALLGPVSALGAALLARLAARLAEPR